MKQFISAHGRYETFTVFSPTGESLDAAAKQTVFDDAAVVQGFHPGAFQAIQWRECPIGSPLFADLEARGAFVTWNGQPVWNMGNPDRRVVDIRRLDILDRHFDAQPELLDAAWFLDNTWPTFRPGLHGGADWIDPGSYSVAVYRAVEHIRKRFPNKPLMWNGPVFKYPDYLVGLIMGLTDLALMEKPKLSWTAPPTAAELSDLARYMRLLDQYGERIAIVCSPASEPGTPGWANECRTAAALVQIASPDSPFAIQQNYTSLHLFEPPWGDLGESAGQMVAAATGTRYTRDFENGMLAVDLGTGRIECGRTFPLWN